MFVFFGFADNRTSPGIENNSASSGGLSQEGATVTTAEDSPTTTTEVHVDGAMLKDATDENVAADKLNSSAPEEPTVLTAAVENQPITSDVDEVVNTTNCSAQTNVDELAAESAHSAETTLVEDIPSTVDIVLTEAVRARLESTVPTDGLNEEDGGEKLPEAELSVQPPPEEEALSSSAAAETVETVPTSGDNDFIATDNASESKTKTKKSKKGELVEKSEENVENDAKKSKKKTSKSKKSSKKDSKDAADAEQEDEGGEG